MKTIKALGALLIICVRIAAAQTRAPIDSTTLARLADSVFTAGMKREHIPGAAFVLVQHGRVVLAKGFGTADVASGRPVIPDRTIFPIASISKVFTATAVMQLVDRNRINLTTDVNRYLTSLQVPATYKEPVTAAHLLTHTAGFDELPGRRVRSAKELVQLAQFLRNRLIRVHRPGELTSYSSYGMALAGLLVADVSGEPFERYLQRNIWEPLAMRRTFITVPPARRGDLATAYELEDDKLVAIPYELYQTPPASAIVSTVTDMARFMTAHLQKGAAGRMLSERAALEMQRRHATMHPLVPGWALGFQEDDANGRRILEHGGDIGGFSALMTLLPDDDVGIFVVHHLEGRNLRFDVRKAILDRFFPDRRPRVIPVPRATDAARLARFAGKYRPGIYCHTCNGTGPSVPEFEVSVNADGTLSMTDARWVEVSPRYFVRADGKERIGFAEDSAGRIVAATAGSWRVLERVH